MAARALALAVSGGSDSLALMLLVHRLSAIEPRFSDTLILTVDHSLRAASAAEAAMVAARAAALGFAHRTLVWTGPKPAAGLQEAARTARYRLLAEATGAAGRDMLVTAHTRDDQAETVLLALARGSGVYGLAAMPAARPLGPLTLARPLLGTSRAELRAVLSAAGQTWIDDPSNADPRFARARLRREAGRLDALGLTPDRLSATAAGMARAAAALDTMVDRLLDRAGRPEWNAIAVSLDLAALLAEPDEIALRALARLIRSTGGRSHVPRLAHVEALLASLRDGRMAPRTLAGTLVAVSDTPARLWLAPEPGRAAAPLALTPGATVCWAGRFLVSLPGTAPGPVLVARAGTAALGLIRRANAAGDAPPALIAAQPGLFAEGKLVALPALGLAPDAGWQDATACLASATEPLRDRNQSVW